MDIQVGDKVTYKYKDGTEIKEVAINEDDVSRLKAKPVIKVERPKYEVVEEKKELLTEEEKADLKDIIENVNKYSCMEVNTISFRETNNGKLVINCFDNDYCIFEMVIPKKFSNLNKSERYTLKELGLEES